MERTELQAVRYQRAVLEADYHQRIMETLEASTNLVVGRVEKLARVSATAEFNAALHQATSESK